MLAFVRRYSRELFATAFAVTLAVWWLWPARHVDGAALAAASVDDTVEVTLESVERLSSKPPDAPIALGRVGGRLLLVRTDGGSPREPTQWGKLREPLPAEMHYLELRRTHGEDPYPVLLDASRRGHGFGHRLQAMWSLFGVAFMWLYRLYRWRWADRRPPRRFAFDGPVPRDAAMAAAVARRHSVRAIAFVFMLFVAISVLAIQVIGPRVDPRFDVWTYTVGAVVFFAASSLFGERRLRARLARVVRDGELVTGRIVEATAKAQRPVAGERTYVTRLKVSLPTSERTAIYRATVVSKHDAASWATVGAEVRAVTSALDRLAIVVTPDGDDLAAHRLRR